MLSHIYRGIVLTRQAGKHSLKHIESNCSLLQKPYIYSVDVYVQRRKRNFCLFKTCVNSLSR